MTGAWPAPTDVAFLAGVLLLLQLARRWMPLFALLVWPGTVLHELSHWGVALLLGGKPTAPDLVPVRTERGRWRLGSIGIRRVRWFNALPIGLAPLLLAPAAVWLLLHATRTPATHWSHWLGLYGVAAIAASCLPSIADWKIVASRPLGSLLYLLLAAGLAWVAWHR